MRWPWSKAKTAPRADDYVNALTGFGTARDKRRGGRLALRAVTALEAEELWRASHLVSRMIEVPPAEMTRAGWCLSVADDDGDGEEARQFAELIEGDFAALGGMERFREALSQERAYGGAAIMPVLNDSRGNLAAPLNTTLAAEVRSLVLLEASELTPVSYYSDLSNPKFGQVEVWQLQASVAGGSPPPTQRIHETRLIVFPGIRVTRRDVPGKLTGWGDSVLTRALGPIRMLEGSYAAAAALLEDFAQAVFKLSGLKSQEDLDSLVDRVKFMDTARSVLRAIVIDAEDEFERKATPLSGLSEMMDRFAAFTASAMDMPLTLLMGQSPGGLNATGDSDVRFFYDRVAARRESHLAPRMRPLIEMLMRARGRVPENWSIQFKSLWQESEKERADARKVQADIDAAYTDRNILSPAEVRRSRFGGDAYSYETKLDPEFDAMLEAAPPAPADSVADAPGDSSAGAGGTPDEE